MAGLISRKTAILLTMFVLSLFIDKLIFYWEDTISHVNITKMIFLSSNESLWVVNNAQSTYYLWIEHEEIGSLDRESAGQKGKSDQWNALDGLYE